jgi:hypothetical protein
MALYYPIVSNPNSIGGIKSPLVVLNTSSNFSAFTQQAATEELVLKNMTITCINQDVTQLSQPVTFSTLDANGNQSVKVITPNVNPYQFQAQITDLPSDAGLSSLNTMNYTVISGNTVRLKFKFGAKDKLGDLIKKVMGYDKISWEMIIDKELGLAREPGEQKIKKSEFEQILIQEQKEANEEKKKPRVIRRISTPIADFFEPKEGFKTEETVNADIPEFNTDIHEFKEPEEIRPAKATNGIMLMRDLQEPEEIFRKEALKNKYFDKEVPV